MAVGMENHPSTSAPQHLATSPPRHLATLPPRHLATSPPRHLATSPSHDSSVGECRPDVTVGGGGASNSCGGRRSCRKGPLRGVL